MKPLLNCPYCGCHLGYHSNTTGFYYTFCPDYCTMGYHQNFREDHSLWNLKLYTSHFILYIYFDDGNFPNETLIYSRSEAGERRNSKYLIRIPTTKLNIATLEAVEKDGRYDNTAIRGWLKDLDDKLQTLALFA